MKIQNKLTSILGVASLAVMALTSCEGGDLYSVDSPDWIAARVDSIAEAKKNDVPEQLDLMEDVYTIGKTDFSSGWWAEFSKYYVVPDGKKWQAQFNLNINPSDDTYYKNFALVVANTVRGGDGYSEYGAIRYDLTGDANAFNSNWGTVFGQIEGNGFKYTESNLMLAPVDNKDAAVQKLGGKVTLTIDRTDANRFYIEMNNGTAVKTFNMPANIEPGGDIYCFLVPEGSYINFIGTDIEPIGGCTSKEDKQPLGITLKGVPGKVMQGTVLDSLITSVSAIIDFETGVTKEVSYKDLTFQAIPDLNGLGEKTLIAVYNQTYKGEGAAKPVIGNATFNVVDKMYNTLGESSCTTGWWGAHSTNIKVAPGETVVSTFTNYTSGGSNWNNWVMVLCKEDNSEYAVVRADNYGWGAGYEGIATATCDNGGDWGAWLAAMNGAKVTTFVTNYGDGTADINAVIIGNDGNTYTQSYTGISVNDPEDVWFRFTVDGSCLVFDDVLGAEDCTSGWWSAHSQNINVPAGMSMTQTFINHTSGNNNWNNWVLVLCKEDNSEYAVVSADNYGWGAGYEGIATATCDNGGDWGAWLSAMEGARVTVTVTNNGDGTADILATIIGNGGEEFWQKYEGISISDPDDVFFRFTVDGSCLIFDAN